jgi:hypothetical protein
MVSVAGSAIENLCGRFRHRKRSQNVVGRTDAQFVIIYKIANPHFFNKWGGSGVLFSRG